MAQKAKRASDAALKELRAFGLAFPGAHPKSPWPGHLDLAVNDKTFAYLSIDGEPFSIGCKLPASQSVALMLPFVTPMAYGLGKSGWVSAQLADQPVPIEMFKAWIEESYRAQAPKKLVAQIGAEVVVAKKKSTAKKKPAAKKKRA
jgi:predicted DNA-binding protein (MmcQ/YjbR family)